MEQLVRADIQAISFQPKSVVDEVLQNVRTILTTIRGSVPLDREFGIDGTLIDQPTPVARAKLTGEIVAALNQYEPRVKVVKVTFTEDGDGRLIPSIRVRIDE